LTPLTYLPIEDFFRPLLLTNGWKTILRKPVLMKINIGYNDLWGQRGILRKSSKR
jgi:hypothetical protein